MGAPNLLNDQPWDVARLASAELLHPTPDRRDWRNWLQRMGLADKVSLKGGQVFDTLELGMIAAARGYGVSMGDLLMVAEDVAQGRLSLPWPTAVASGEHDHLVWPKTRPGGERLRRLSDFSRARSRPCNCPMCSVWAERCSWRASHLALIRPNRSSIWLCRRIREDGTLVQKGSTYTSPE